MKLSFTSKNTNILKLLSNNFWWEIICYTITNFFTGAGDAVLSTFDDDFCGFVGEAANVVLPTFGEEVSEFVGEGALHEYAL